jgi:uncharacterized protein (DUF488 family)
MVLYTIGHSIRPMEEFLGLLKDYRIAVLVDVRAFPVSQRNPHFHHENLRTVLPEAGVEYVWMGKELGGYRKGTEGLGERSPNKGWKTEGFRIYADYMMTEGFRTAAATLLELAREQTLAYMCAEKLPRQCHRQLLSDYLHTLGHEVRHIIEHDVVQTHELTYLARVKEGVLTYPHFEEPSTPLLPF